MKVEPSRVVLISECDLRRNLVCHSAAPIYVYFLLAASCSRPTSRSSSFGARTEPKELQAA